MVRRWWLLVLALLLVGCTYQPVGLRPIPRPELPAGPASPCGWQLLGNSALALPGSADRIWLCGLGWDDQPLEGQAVTDLLAVIDQHRIDPAQACGGVGSQPFLLFFDGLDGKPDTRTGMIGLPGDCFFAEHYAMGPVLQAIRAAFTAAHGPARTQPVVDPCRAAESDTDLLGGSPTVVVLCQNPDWPATGLAGSSIREPSAAQQVVLSRMFTGARLQFRYFQADIPDQASVLRVGTDQGVRTIWFDGKDLWLPGEVIYQIGPRQDVLAALRQLTGR